MDHPNASPAAMEVCRKIFETVIDEPKVERLHRECLQLDGDLDLLVAAATRKSWSAVKEKTPSATAMADLLAVSPSLLHNLLPEADIPSRGEMLSCAGTPVSGDDVRNVADMIKFFCIAQLDQNPGAVDDKILGTLERIEGATISGENLGFSIAFYFGEQCKRYFSNDVLTVKVLGKPDPRTGLDSKFLYDRVEGTAIDWIGGDPTVRIKPGSGNKRSRAGKIVSGEEKIKNESFFRIFDGFSIDEINDHAEEIARKRYRLDRMLRFFLFVQSFPLHVLQLHTPEVNEFNEGGDSSEDEMLSDEIQSGSNASDNGRSEESDCSEESDDGTEQARKKARPELQSGCKQQ
jgi:hypothetical protein